VRVVGEKRVVLRERKKGPQTNATLRRYFDNVIALGLQSEAKRQGQKEDKTPLAPSPREKDKEQGLISSIVSGKRGEYT